MDIIKTVRNRKAYRARYDFYRSLGYGEQAAAVLSVLTYGNRETAFLVKKLGEEDFVSRAYQWFQKQKDGSPEDAVDRFYRNNGIGSGAVSPVSRPRQFPFMGLREIRDPSFSCLVNDLDMGFCSITPPSKARRSLSFDQPSASRQMRFCDIEDLSADEYEPLEEKRPESVLTSPSSTFRMTTSNASTGIVFNQLRSGRRIDMSQVRIEEMLNAFDYRHEAPAGEKFRISTELRRKPSGKKLLYVHVQAAEEQRQHQNIVLLLDVSGSMGDDSEVTQAAAATVISKLNPGDIFSLITYSTQDRTVVSGYLIGSEDDKEALLGILMGIDIEGCTNGSAGIETAYRIGARYCQPGWSNQVILITDGDLNFGITGKGGLEHLIEEKKRSSLFLSVIGTGLYNYRDDKLEVLSKHGNGTYCVVNTVSDVDDFINRRYAALTNVVARDVKAQVEFNPRFVKEYRLLGYENRRLNHGDFRDDTVISEPYGSGGHGVALYELEMRDPAEPVHSDLKYQSPQLTDSDEICTVRVRYKNPLGDESTEIEKAVYDQDHSTENLELAYTLYCIAEELRGSDQTDSDDRKQLGKLLRGEYSACFGHDTEKLELLVKALQHQHRDGGRS